MMHKNLKLIRKIGKFDYYEYTPRITRLFYKHNEKMTLVKRIRFMLDYIRGYKVFYIMQNGEMVGYCMVTRGGSYRLKFTDGKDIVLGPAFIAESNRGQGLNGIMCGNILNEFNLNYQYAYTYIRKTNMSSIKSFEKVGFVSLSSARMSKFLKIIQLCSNRVKATL